MATKKSKKAKKAKTKTAAPAATPTATEAPVEVEAAPPAPSKKAKAAPKDEKKRKATPFDKKFLEQQAYHGSRDPYREINKFVKRERREEAEQPLDFLKRLTKQFVNVDFTTSMNAESGDIVRIRDYRQPKVEIRIVTGDNYPGMVGFGRPVYKGSKTKTNGVALQDVGKLDGLKDQANKVGKYWWCKPTKNSFNTFVRMMEKVGFEKAG